MDNVYLEIDGLEDSETLWRYMDLAKFVSMLEKSALWLARADTFRDMHEGRFPDVMRNAIEKAYEEFKNDQITVKDADDFQDYLRKNTFISCWHKNADENMVMWEIYCREKRAVAVQTTVENMRECVRSEKITGHSLIMKDVIYKSPSSITGILPYENCFFFKRPHFAFEEEVRISLDTYDRYRPSKNTPYGYSLPVFLNGLIESIVVHPDASDWFISVIKSITEKYEIHAPVIRGKCGTK